MEYEFIALDKVGEEVEWLQNFLKDIPFWPKSVGPIAYIAIVKQQYVGQGDPCTMVSLIIYNEDITR